MSIQDNIQLLLSNIDKYARRISRQYPTLGPWIFVFGILYYFVVQYIVALAWPVSFSLKQNFISDLGNTVCGLQQSVYICSPLNVLMNLSFIVIGLALGIATFLVYGSFSPSLSAKLAFSLIGIADFGTALIGFLPENVAHGLHLLIAILCLAAFNFGVAVAYLLPDLPKSWQLYSISSGGFGLVALLLLGFRINTPLGLGGIERIADYTPDLWVLSFGIYALFRSRSIISSSQIPV